MLAAATAPRWPDPGSIARMNSRSLRRLLLGAPAAAVVTLSLVLLMRGLIAPNGDVGSAEREAPPAIDIKSDIVDTPPVDAVRPVEPNEVVAPPPVVIPSVDPITPGAPPVPVGPQPPTVVEQAPDGTGGRIIAAPQRVFTPQPRYPTSMLSREGHCIVAFNVTAAGATEAVRAIDCSHNGFARAAEEAVERTVYRPAQGEMGPVEVIGLSIRIDFQLAD